MTARLAGPEPLHAGLGDRVFVTPRQIREWTQLVLGAICILQQLVAVTLGRQPEIVVWSGGVALLGATLLSFADPRHDKSDKDDDP